jgi:hypothetical protein
VCFPVNAILETGSKLYQLIYPSVPIHTSTNAAKAGARVNFGGYKRKKKHTQTQSLSFSEKNRIMLSGEIIAVDCENHTKPRNILSF